MKSYFCLLSVLFLSDFYVKYENVSIRNNWTRAILDNLNHGIAGGVSWLMTRSYRGAVLSEKSVLTEALTCAFLASLIDIDHFLEARSFNINDATSLKSRPFLHCSTLLLFVSILLLSIASTLHLWWFHIFSLIIHTSTSTIYTFSSIIYTFSFITFVAWTTHHLRDGVRRGLLLSPFGSTPPINYGVYLLLITFLPIFTAYMDEMTSALMDEMTSTLVMSRSLNHRYQLLKTEIV